MSKRTVYGEDAKMENQPRVKQMVRSIANITDELHDAAASVDAELSMLINEGWRLISVHYAGSDPIGHTMIYVLVKD